MKDNLIRVICVIRGRSFSESLRTVGGLMIQARAFPLKKDGLENY